MDVESIECQRRAQHPGDRGRWYPRECSSLPAGNLPPIQAPILYRFTHALRSQAPGAIEVRDRARASIQPRADILRYWQGVPYTRHHCPQQQGIPAPCRFFSCHHQHGRRLLLDLRARDLGSASWESRALWS